ncbi:MAG: enoyl-CoA hydratase/isomerase family protein [Haliea sp.]
MDADMTGGELLQETSGDVVTLTFNRPEAKNAMNPAMRDSLMSALSGLAVDEGVRAVVLRGNSGSFIAGGDLHAFAATLKLDREARRQNFHDRVNVSSQLVDSLIDFPKPLIAVMEGDAAGAGISIALCCDFVIASSATRLSFAHVHVGLPLDLGLSYFLPRASGTLQAKRLAMLGARISAEEALGLGLVTMVTPEGEVDSRLDELLTALSSISLMALKAIKREFRCSGSNSLTAQMSLEAKEVGDGAATEAFEQRVSAFVGR